ncbi:MAG: hypothetical protein JKP96_12120, partial [Oceanicaulis sp.]|nr:hypothetical protein [Oceanicaulis sp.]
TCSNGSWQAMITSAGRPLLARDLRPALFDADLSLEPGESVDMALDRFGKAGLTRIRQV